MSRKTKKKKKKASGNGGKAPMPKLPGQIDFHYVKGPDFQTIHVDGAIGGITPKNLLHIAMYSERPAIPQQITHRIEEDGSLGKEIKRSGKSGVVRQMEVDLFMTEDTARSLKVWLDEKLEAFEQRMQDAIKEDKK